MTGPLPHSVAVFARPTNKQPPEHLILDHRRQEDQRQKVEELTRSYKLCDLKNDWERCTDRKILNNTVKKRVRKMLNFHESSIQERRQQLQVLLQAEEVQYLEEMAAKEETVLEKQAKMRTRAKQLQEKREAERLSLVKDKLDQQWIDQCEEIRSTLSRRQQDQVATERVYQVQMKTDMEREKLEEDKMFASLWYADIQAKANREDMEKQQKVSANKVTLQILNQQMAALVTQVEEEKRLEGEEGTLLKEQAELWKLEQRHALEEKQRCQKETRRVLDRSMQMKRENQAKENKEQLAFDLVILEQLLERSTNETMEQAQRKCELHEEDRQYQKYMAQLKEQEMEYEKELDKMWDAEMEKMWRNKIAQWRLEKEARKKLLEDVIAVRKTQVSHKLLEKEKRIREVQREKEEMMNCIKESKNVEHEQHIVKKTNNLVYQSDLVDQIMYNRKLDETIVKEEKRIWKSQLQAESEYQTKLELVLNSTHIEKLHPMRKTHSGRNRSQSNI